MKLKTLLLTTAFVVSSAIFGGCASHSMDVKRASQYVFRGAQYNSNPVVQPTVATKDSVKGADVGLWGFANYDLKSKEVDQISAWGEAGEETSVGYPFVGFYYTESPLDLFPATSELYVGAILLHLPLTPSLLAVRDLRATKGDYIEGSLEKSISLGDLTLTPKLIFARNDGYSVEGRQDHVEGSFKLGFPLGEHASIEASVNKLRNLSESVGDLKYNTIELKFEW